MNGFKRPLSAVALAAAAILAASPAPAHEGHHHTAMGTVKTIAAETLELENKAGKLETFALTETTTYKRGEETAKREDVKVGERAVVMYETKAGRNLALKVRLAAAEAERAP